LALRILKLLSLERGELSLLFVNDLKMRALNAQHRGVDANTDVLSFPLYDSVGEIQCQIDAVGSAPVDAWSRAPILLGDVVINPQRAAVQAQQYGLTLDEELTRLMVHGVLHLIGYDHERNRYQAQKMFLKQEEIIRALAEMDRQRK
jgi:probable rRNA maturation factor